MTGFPPPHSVTWDLAWEGEQLQHHQQSLNTTEQTHHHLALSYSLDMSAHTSSSQVEVTCSACNSLGCGTSSSLTLYVVGKTAITATVRGSFSF